MILETKIKMVLELLGKLVESRMRINPHLAKKMRSPWMKSSIERYLEKYQFLKLRKIIKHAQNSPYYKKIFREIGIKPREIKSFRDLEKIPFTNPKDLQADPRQFFAVPKSEFVRVFTTAGTSGEPKKIYFTKKDLEIEAWEMAVAMNMLYGINERDIVRIMYLIGIGIESWGTWHICQSAMDKIGAMSIFLGETTPEQEIEVMKTYEPNIIMGIPSRMNYLTEEMKRLCDLEEFGIDKIILGAEPTPSSLRKRLENSWNAEVFEGYGLAEMCVAMAGECEEKNGMHIDEGSFLVEVVDPETGEQLEEGEVGELIFTTLNREGMPLIRYRSRDLGKLIGECDCKIPFKKLKIEGRTDGMFIVAGQNIFPTMLDKALFGLPEVIEYRAVIEKENSKDLITILVETNSINDSTKKKIDDVLLKMPELKDGIMKAKTVKKPIIKLVKPGTLDRNEIKMRRIIDKRNLYS